MDFNFTLVLFFAVVVTGIIWLLHSVVLKNTPIGQFGFVESVASFFPILLVVFVIRSFLFEPFQIPSKSMVPTLEVGDFILVNKFSYGVRLPIIGNKVIPVSEPKVGDVMVFVPPHDERYFIKRVIGLPGDHIVIEENQVWVNGVLYEQEFIETIAENMNAKLNLITETTGEVSHQIQTMAPASNVGRSIERYVPEGHYFMMGDNRDASSDSRSWGAVPEENIVGKAVAIWMHWENWGIPSFSRTGAID